MFLIQLGFAEMPSPLRSRKRTRALGWTLHLMQLALKMASMLDWQVFAQGVFS
jgi:hypothetical protein